MVQALTKTKSFSEFLEYKPDGGRDELHNGLIIEMQPKGKHEQISVFLATKLTLEYAKMELPYFIPKQALVNIPSKDTAYYPDVLILNNQMLDTEPLWEKFSTVQKGTSIPLVVEVVSSNWRDDYFYKLGDYEEIGIPEYWIVDYLGLGGRRFIGNPKQPTISIYQLVDEEYQVSQYQNDDLIISSTFPELNLTAQQIFEASIG